MGRLGLLLVGVGVGGRHVGFVARGGARGVVAKGVAGMLVVGFAAVVVDGRGRMGGEACSIEAATAGAAAGRRHGVVGGEGVVSFPDGF